MKRRIGPPEKAKAWREAGYPLPKTTVSEYVQSLLPLLAVPEYSSKLHGIESDSVGFWAPCKKVLGKKSYLLVDGRTIELPKGSYYLNPHFVPFDLRLKDILSKNRTAEQLAITSEVLHYGIISLLLFLLHKDQIDPEEKAFWIISGTNMRMAKSVLPLGFTLVKEEEKKMRFKKPKNDDCRGVTIVGDLTTLRLTLHDPRTRSILMRLGLRHHPDFVGQLEEAGILTHSAR